VEAYSLNWKGNASMKKNLPQPVLHYYFDTKSHVYITDDELEIILEQEDVEIVGKNQDMVDLNTGSYYTITPIRIIGFLGN
jgi:hypothetical protein